MSQRRRRLVSRRLSREHKSRERLLGRGPRPVAEAWGRPAAVGGGRADVVTVNAGFLVSVLRRGAECVVPVQTGGIFREMLRGTLMCVPINVGGRRRHGLV